MDQDSEDLLDPLRIAAKLLANLIIIRVLIVGLVCIHFGWPYGVATGVVWLVASNYLTDTVHGQLIQRMFVTMHRVQHQTCGHGPEHAPDRTPEQGSEHHGDGHTP